MAVKAAPRAAIYCGRDVHVQDDLARRTRSNICAPELYAVEGVVMRLLREWTAADQLIAAALTPRQQPAARAS